VAGKPSRYALSASAPGPMGMGFLKQWAAAGISKKLKLYPLYTAAWPSLRTIGKEAVGSIRGPYKYNVDGKPPIVTKGAARKDHKDVYWQNCPAKNRM
jgi:hypothetical protein